MKDDKPLTEWDLAARAIYIILLLLIGIFSVALMIYSSWRIIASLIHNEFSLDDFRVYVLSVFLVMIDTELLDRV